MPKISQLPTDSSPTLTDYVPVLDQETTTTKRSLLSSIRDLVFDNIPSASPINTGWLLKNPSGSTLPTPNTVTYNGNRSYDLVYNSVDMTSYLSTGMRTRFTRTTSAPIQCTSLNGSSQYFNKTSPSGITFTDDFVVSAWVKLSSYALGTIVSRLSTSGSNNGWSLDINASGQVLLYGLTSSTSRTVTAYQSVPLNKWVHITAQLDMSAATATTTTCYVMYDGVDVPAAVTSAGGTPSSLTQAGNLDIGARNSAVSVGQYFPGKIAQVAIFSAKVTQATMRTYMSQGLAGNETSLASAYSLSGSVNDLNANANNLTAQGSATTTNSDSPFGLLGDGSLSTTLTYGLITKTAFSTNTTVTVQCYEGNTIPTSGGISAMAYSIQKIPYNFPVARNLWVVTALLRIIGSTASPSTNTWYNLAGFQAYIPTGHWTVKYNINAYTDKAVAGQVGSRVTLSTANNTEIERQNTVDFQVGAAQNTVAGSNLHNEIDIQTTTATLYYLNSATPLASIGNLYFLADRSAGKIEAIPAYL